MSALDTPNRNERGNHRHTLFSHKKQQQQCRRQEDEGCATRERSMYTMRYIYIYRGMDEKTVCVDFRLTVRCFTVPRQVSISSCFLRRICERSRPTST